MKFSEASFEKKCDFVSSFVCAGLLTLAMFSILPLSMGGFRAENSGEVPLKLAAWSEDFSESSKSGKSSASEFNPPASPSCESPAVQVAEGFDGIVSRNIRAAKFVEFDVPADYFAVSDFPINADAEGFGRSVFEIDSLDAVPRRLRSPSVKYPPILLERGIEGEARLLVVIETDGSVTVEGIENDCRPEFASAASEGAAKMLFEIPTKNGRPVRARFTLPVPFKIQR